jgi:phosphoadenosine phosphosulfate reductase
MLPIQEPLWLDHMVQHSLDLIRKHATAEPYHVAFSGGKDSVVVLDLVRRAGVPHKAVYYVTTFDPPELVRFIKREYPEVEFLKPERRFEDLVRQKQILPTRWRRYCCQSLKERRFKDAVVITGVRAEESVRRRSWLDFNTARRGRTQRRAVLCPILRWASDELWEYIEARNLPTCSL